MAKHVTAADEVIKGDNFGYLGRFKDRKILEQGHNTVHTVNDNTGHATDPEPGQSALEKCLKGCETKGIVRRRTCEANCLINN